MRSVALSRCSYCGCGGCGCGGEKAGGEAWLVKDIGAPECGGGAILAGRMG